MSLTKRVGLAVGAVTLTLTGASFGETTGTNDQDLRAQIADLQNKVEQLQANQGESWMTEQRATEIRSLVQDVLQDADTRASLLQGGFAGGHDGNGFFIGNSDGSFRLNIRGQMQARYMFNQQDDAFNEGSGGFENSRTKLIFDGNVVNPDWTYRIEGNFQYSGGTFGLQDAWINYNYGSGWNVTVGQFKLPGLREELVHSSMGQAVERSLINSAFSGDRSQGIMLNYDGDQFRLAASFNDGLRGLNSPALGFDTEYSFGGRAEVLFAGNWDQFDDFSSWSGEDFGFLLGGSIHFQEGEFGSVGTETETLILSIDGSAEFGGANLFGAFVYSDFDTMGATDFNPFGFILQGGFFVTDDWELFGRFEFGDTDIVGSEDLSILTIGATKFISGNHDLKWTTDIGFAFDEVDSFWGSSADAMTAGWRSDATDDDGQVVVRTQLQLLF